MRRYQTNQIRNPVLIGHSGGGKTSLAEAMLFRAGLLDRLGSVEAGTALADSDPEEIARKTSITLALLPFEWADTKINLLDTPGYADFAGEVAAALRVADAFLLVVDAVAGIQVETARYWEQARVLDLPGLVVINRLDKENANFEHTLHSLREHLGANILPLALPLGAPSRLAGCLDLLSGKAYSEDPAGRKETSPPAGLETQIEEAKEKLLEAAAEAEEELTNKYLEGETLSPEEVRRGLRARVGSGSLFLALPAAATSVLGVHGLLDAIVAFLPSPAERPPLAASEAEGDKTLPVPPREEDPVAALVFKTTADPYAGRLSYFRTVAGVLHADSSLFNPTRDSRERVGQLLVPRGKQQEALPAVPTGDFGLIAKLRETLSGDTLCDESRPLRLPGPVFPEGVYSVSIKPKSKGDEDRLGAALARIAEEDPSLRSSVDPQTRETLLSGLGDLQIEIAVARLKRRFNVEVETGVPKIPYRETVKSSSSVQGKYKKQTGGRGQYGDVWLRLEPLERGAGFEFANEISGGVVPRNYIPAVEKGVREAMERGVLAGYPVTDLRVAMYDGSYHNVDSSDIAFKIAGSLALQKGVLEADPCLLEPIASIEVLVSQQNMGDIMGSLNSKRGRILGLESRGAHQLVKALVPLAEIAHYATELRSLTGGRASYSLSLSHYEELPAHLAQGIIQQAKDEKTKEK
jgi:elongation factor G